MSRRRKRSNSHLGDSAPGSLASAAGDAQRAPPPRPPRRRPWFLALAIFLQAAWIAFLAVLAVKG